MIDFSKARVVVIGDLIEDRWIYGRVDRLSPEGPWPVFLPEREVVQQGGAANVAQNMRALGVAPRMLAPHRVATKERYVAGRHQLFRVDLEETAAIDKAEEDELYEALVTSDPLPHVVVLSDYGKGCFGGVLAQRVIQWCNLNNILTVVDPKGDWHRYRGATVITPNEKEFSDNATSMELVNSVYFVLLTRGAEGMELTNRINLKAVNIPAIGPKVVDIVGAGDTVVAALALALAAGYSMEQAARIANAAAGVVVGKPGTAVCTIDELDEVYSDLPEVGIANGCFDILHAGHIELLNAASRRCQKLVVALNSDRSVGRMKGTRRPVNSLATRMFMLSSLTCVDEIREFDTEEELVEIIQATGAAVIFKGADYKGRPVTGSDIARVEIIDTKFKSSTNQELSKVSGVWS